MRACAGSSTGPQIFRYDTSGDDLWGGALRLHEAIAGADHGGVARREPRALAVGPVDAERCRALRKQLARARSTSTIRPRRWRPPAGRRRRREGHLRRGRRSPRRSASSAPPLTVDDSPPPASAAADGWPNRDLDAVRSGPRRTSPVANLLASTTRRCAPARELGPGRFDAQLFLDAACRPRALRRRISFRRPSASLA
jgi:hypothetical protein